MKRYLISLILVMVLALGWSIPALAATTADVTVTATGEYIAISDNVVAYDFGTVAASSTTDMPTSWIGITNTSSVQTDQAISVTGATWTGGIPWTHSDTATAGADTVGLKASKGTGAFNVVVKNAAPNYIAENQAATTSYDYELELLAPTSYSDGVQKTNTVRITAAAG